MRMFLGNSVGGSSPSSPGAATYADSEGDAAQLSALAPPSRAFTGDTSVVDHESETLPARPYAPLDIATCPGRSGASAGCNTKVALEARPAFGWKPSGTRPSVRSVDSSDVASFRILPLRSKMVHRMLPSDPHDGLSSRSVAGSVVTTWSVVPLSRRSLACPASHSILSSVSCSMFSSAEVLPASTSHNCPVPSPVLRLLATLYIRTPACGPAASASTQLPKAQLISAGVA
mmetsp:Transcript_26518/g.66689  ORF Transcript_26518/g.66689 Transcript_26518/m.66689 type:complete len:231 (+) Transcript_26518:490-1182(+)